VGHGETYLEPHDVLWWSKGGVLRGQSPERLAFLRKVLEDSPAAGIDPVDKWQDPRIGGQAPNYYLIYFGKEQPSTWSFSLPRDKLANGMKFKVDILDTWNMTTTPVDGFFTVQKNADYGFGDADNRTINLPGKPYIALRIRRENEPSKTASK
jgi:hypothetical protein